MAPLSRNDKLVLGALFDAEGSTARVASIDSNTLSLPGISSSTLRSLQDRERQAIRPLNDEEPSNTRITTAITDLTHLINENPKYASAWNNRAQAVRMLVGDDLTVPAAASSSLYSDLCEACHLAAPTPSNPTASSLQAKILASAHTHRAHLLLRASKSIKENSEKGQDLPKELRGADSETLERMAGRDFQMGGKYGNPIAKQMAVQLNPYAKMCGEIVKEAMQRDLREAYGESACVRI